MRSATGLLACTPAGWLCRARAVLLWLLCATVPLYGAAGVRLTTLGPTHHHRAAPAVVQSHDHRSLAQTWRDFVHRGLQALAGRDAAQALDTARMRQLQVQGEGEPRHVHAHSPFERHHHAGDDPTVVLDGHDGPSLSEVAALGAHVLPMMSVDLPRIPAPPEVDDPWPPDAAPTWRSIGRLRLERPPRH